MAEALEDESSGGEQDSGANEIGQGRQYRQKRCGEDRSENTGEAAGALGDANGRPLLVIRCEVGEQAEKWRAGEVRANGQETEDKKHPDPWQAFRSDEGFPGELGGAADERQEREADGGENKTERNQFGFAHELHKPTNGAALDKGADNAAVGVEVHDGRGRSRVMLEIEVKIVADH